MGDSVDIERGPAPPAVEAAPPDIAQPSGDPDDRNPAPLVAARPALVTDVYRRLVQDAGHILWTASAHGLTDAEGGWSPYTGQTLADVRAWGWLGAVHPDDRAGATQAWMRALADSAPYQTVYRIRRHDGVYRTFLVRGVPVPDESDDSREWAHFASDITSHQAAAAALRASEERLGAVVANAPIVLFAVDRDGVFTLSEGRGLQTLGIVPDAHVGQSYFALYGGLPDSVAVMRRALQGESATTIERFKGFVFETRWTPTRGADGTVTGVIGVSADITARARVEEERAGLERRTRETLDALLEMAQAVVRAPDDAEGAGGDDGQAARAIGRRLVELTRRVLGCERIGLAAVEPGTGLQRPLAVVGLSPEQELTWWASVDGQPLVDPQAPADPELVARFLAGEVLVLDLTQPPYRDQPNPLGVRSALIAPLRIGTDIVGLLSYDYGGAAHDYTAEEIALAAAVARLAALTIERERLLREREDARASALALREANRRMDEFLGIASHELRTPLTGLRGSLQIMQRRLDRVMGGDEPSVGDLAGTLSKLSPFLNRAIRQSGALAGLVDDLLDLSRIQTGHLQLRLAPRDLVAVVEQAVEEERTLDPLRSISLEAPPTPVPVNVDADRVGQVVTHYLTNAIKYSAPEQPIRVGVGVGDGLARVWVSDEGPGVPPAEQERIWDRFYRAEETERRSGSSVGLGLGLYISRTIVERHGGRVGMESLPGAGATFWLTLPLAVPEDDDADGGQAP